MLYRTLKRMIERGQTEGIETKLDIFYAADKISESEYQELLGMLRRRLDDGGRKETHLDKGG